jgi:hypothetical protein
MSPQQHIDAGLALARSLTWEKAGEGMVREVERLLGVGVCLGVCRSC